MAGIAQNAWIGLRGFSTEIDYDLWLKKKKCHECGKTIYIDPLMYQWKHPGKNGMGHPMWYCGYTCWRKEDKRKREKEEKLAAKLMREAAKYDTNGNLVVKKTAGRPRKDGAKGECA